MYIKAHSQVPLSLFLRSYTTMSKVHAYDRTLASSCISIERTPKIPSALAKIMSIQPRNIDVCSERHWTRSPQEATPPNPHPIESKPLKRLFKSIRLPSQRKIRRPHLSANPLLFLCRFTLVLPQALRKKLLQARHRGRTPDRCCLCLRLRSFSHVCV